MGRFIEGSGNQAILGSDREQLSTNVDIIMLIFVQCEMYEQLPVYNGLFHLITVHL